MIFIVPLHLTQVKGSTSYTLRIISAQPLAGIGRSSSSTIRRGKTTRLAFLTLPRWALALGQKNGNVGKQSNPEGRQITAPRRKAGDRIRLTARSNRFFYFLWAGFRVQSCSLVISIILSMSRSGRCTGQDLRSRIAWTISFSFVLG